MLTMLSANENCTITPPLHHHVAFVVVIVVAIAVAIVVVIVAEIVVLIAVTAATIGGRPPGARLHRGLQRGWLRGRNQQDAHRQRGA